MPFPDYKSAMIAAQREFFVGYRGGDTVPHGSAIPGGVAIFGEGTFPILVNGGASCEASVAIAAAGTMGAGRVVAIAHDSYQSRNADPRIQPFIDQCRRWVGQNGGDAEVKEITNAYFTGNNTATSQHEKDAIMAELKAFVWNGGGVIVSQCPWGWAQLAGGDRTVADMEANAFLAGAGLAFLDGYFAGKQHHQAYAVRPPADELLASSAFHAMQLLNSRRNNNGAQQRQFRGSDKQEELNVDDLREVSVTCDPAFMVAASTDLSSARIAIQDGNWWAVASDHLWFVIRFPATTQLSRLDVFCANVDACPRELVVSVCEEEDGDNVGGSGGGTAADHQRHHCDADNGANAFADSRDRVWRQVLRAPYPTRTCTSPTSGEPRNETLQFAIPLQAQRAAKLYKVEFVGIHNSHYIGVNKVTFFHKEEPQGACSALASALKSMPLSERTSVMGVCQPMVRATLLREPSEAMPIRVDARVRLAHSIVNSACEDSNNLCTVNPFAADLSLPGEASFPGRAVGSGLRQTADVTIPFTAQRQWVSTFLYANPSQPLTITINSINNPVDLKAFRSAWVVRVGCHSDSVANCDSWRRWPEISNTYRFAPGATTLTISHRFGGIIFFEAVADNAPSFAYSASNVFRCPHASAETGFELVDGEAPWGEFVGDKIAMCLPCDALVAARASMRGVVAFWDAVVSTHHQLATPPYGTSRRERIVCDRQISCGYMHSGYPIMTHMDFAERAVNVEKMRREGDWGAFHELGHNMQRPWWTWAETVEVSVNWFTVYTMVHLLGKDMATMDFYETAAADLATFNNSGKSYARLATLYFLSLSMFTDVFRAFGWQALKDVLRNYEQSPPNHLGNDQDKRDEFVIRMSLQVQRNLLPYFTTDRCGWPVTADKVLAKVGHLPTWVWQG